MNLQTEMNSELSMSPVVNKETNNSIVDKQLQLMNENKLKAKELLLSITARLNANTVVAVTIAKGNYNA